MLGDYRNKSMGQKAKGRVTVAVKTTEGTVFNWEMPGEPFEWLEITLTKQFGKGELVTTGQNMYEWTVADEQ